MYFERFFDTGLAQASYLIGCQQSGEAIVVDPIRDIDKYLSFVLTMFIAFGITFEVPVVVVVLVRLGVVSLDKLKSIRGYVIVGAFVVGAVFTPPDVVSQCMLAVPLWLLYELGLIVGRFVAVAKEESGAEQGEAAP